MVEKNESWFLADIAFKTYFVANSCAYHDVWVWAFCAKTRILRSSTQIYLANCVKPGICELNLVEAVKVVESRQEFDNTCAR